MRRQGQGERRDQLAGPASGARAGRRWGHAHAVDPHRRAGADRAPRSGDQPARGGARMTTSAALVEQQAAWLARIASSPGRAPNNARPTILGAADRVASASRGTAREGWYADRDAAAVAILVVEADAALGGALVTQLIADGYRAQLARSSEHARVLASDHEPKLAVIGDLNSPRGALELLGEVRDR